MSKSNRDEVLVKLSTIIEQSDVVDTISESETHSLLCLGVKIFNDESGEPESVQTFFANVGYPDVLFEGLYAELTDQIQNGNTTVFEIMREVVRCIEEDLELDPDEPFGESAEEVVLH